MAERSWVDSDTILRRSAKEELRAFTINDGEIIRIIEG
jgi:hypothetical protein